MNLACQKWLGNFTKVLGIGVTPPPFREKFPKNTVFFLENPPNGPGLVRIVPFWTIQGHSSLKCEIAWESILMRQNCMRNSRWSCGVSKFARWKHLYNGIILIPLYTFPWEKNLHYLCLLQVKLAAMEPFTHGLHAAQIFNILHSLEY